MHSAADALEKLSYGVFDDPFADVSWSLPQDNAFIAKCLQYLKIFRSLLGILFSIFVSLLARALPSVGPAVGPGGIAPARLQARNLDAVLNSVPLPLWAIPLVSVTSFLVMPLARPRTSCEWWLTVPTGMRWSVIGGQGTTKFYTDLLQNFGAMEFRWEQP